MLLQLERRVKLVERLAVFTNNQDPSPTSPSSTSGGPAAMSAALVPGCILREAFASSMLCSIGSSEPEEPPREGDWGPICISVGGGGLGSRGDVGGRDMAGSGVCSHDG